MMIHDHEQAMGVRGELAGMIDRARDERFRLLRVVKDYEARLETIPDPASADQVTRLMDAVRKLDGAIDQRMTTLHTMDQRIDQRMQEMVRFESTLTELSQTLTAHLNQARQLAGHHATQDLTPTVRAQTPPPLRTLLARRITPDAV